MRIIGYLYIIWEHDRFGNALMRWRCHNFAMFCLYLLFFFVHCYRILFLFHAESNINKMKILLVSLLLVRRPDHKPGPLRAAAVESS